MASLKGSRFIPLASKEAKKLISQSGLSLIHHISTKTGEESQPHLPESSGGVVIDHDLESKPQCQREAGELYCQSCHVTLGDREEQLVHYRLDWHRYNLKRRLKGLASLSQEEFEKIAGGDLSSISGSESDSDSSKDEEANLSLTNIEEDCYDEDSSSSSKSVGSPFLYFSSQDGCYYAVYRSLVTNLKPAEVRSSLSSDLLGSLANLTQPQVWIILMRAGGHFAGAVFKGSAMVAHKTFHRYTVRAKRGTAQSIRDAHQGGHAPKSAGASLRRYNESALVGEIRELLSSWSSHVEEATAIFIRTPKYGKGVFIGGGTATGGGNAPFLRTDPRLRNIPFVTRRPTVKEVQNVFSKLAAVYEVSSDQLSQGFTRSPKAKPKKPVVNVKEKETVGELEDGFLAIEEVGAQLNELELHQDGSSDELERESSAADRVTEKTAKRKKRRRAKKTTEPQADIPASIQKLLKLCKSEGSDDFDESMMQLLQEMGISTIASFEIEDPSAMESSESTTAGSVSEIGDEVSAGTKNLLNEVWNGDTVLHVAAASGNASLIPILLLHGANPAIKNGAGHTAYVVAKDKSVRDAFRRFMAQHPSSYDYSAARIPSPLTEEMERERKEKMVEKKKALKKAKKQREKEHKTEKELEQSKLNHEKAVAGLSEREKRALAAEKRMSAQLPTSSAVLKAGVCSFCESTLAGRVPFERLEYKYCSMDCLKNHRKQLT